MVFKNKRQVVIINDIKSDSIEQAIFILRDKDNTQKIAGRSDIVAEAERIINSFIGYGSSAVYKPRIKTRKQVFVSTMLWLASAAIVVGVSALILSFI